MVGQGASPGRRAAAKPRQPRAIKPAAAIRCILRAQGRRCRSSRFPWRCQHWLMYAVREEENEP